MIKVEMDGSFIDLRRWLLNRIWPQRYPTLRKAFENFRRVLEDLQNTFHRHAERRTPDNDWFVTANFYQIPEWDKERYDRLAKLWDDHVDLVQDLFLELTRAANFICDEVRATILPGYRRAEGHLTAEWGPVTLDLSYREAVIQYSDEEKSIGTPYPGLEAFKTTRMKRDRHFGGGKK